MYFIGFVMMTADYKCNKSLGVHWVLAGKIFFPLSSGPASLIFSGAGAMAFMGYVVYDTDRLIKCFNYDQRLTASTLVTEEIVGD
ncbi:hypothetical protein GH714_002775 [Hevea brasiliensis]|uniref:Uncharacterized protein n=1 Tax=Hevea brasiliensis TaxID=3981 RepID=A0A6A6KIB9_HEVBR|nr:hypothetical protein GH714_002775 [Hevea brasiliensis]